MCAYGYAVQARVSSQCQSEHWLLLNLRWVWLSLLFVLLLILQYVPIAYKPGWAQSLSQNNDCVWISDYPCFFVVDTLACAYALQASLRKNTGCFWIYDYLCFLCCCYFSVCLCCTSQGKLTASVRTLIASKSVWLLLLLLFCFVVAFVVLVYT